MYSRRINWQLRLLYEVLEQERQLINTTCLYCKGTMEEATTTHVAEIGERVIIIRHVPCYKCIQCGEVVYSGSVVERFEQIIEQLEQALTEIAVVNYSAA